jgi:predicted deacetylase
MGSSQQSGLSQVENAWSRYGGRDCNLLVILMTSESQTDKKTKEVLKSLSERTKQGGLLIIHTGQRV